MANSSLNILQHSSKFFFQAFEQSIRRFASETVSIELSHETSSRNSVTSLHEEETLLSVPSIDYSQNIVPKNIVQAFHERLLRSKPPLDRTSSIVPQNTNEGYKR